MPIATILQQHLASKHIEYDLVPHRATMSSIDTAEACGVPAQCLAKGVVLRTGEGYILVVLPASIRSGERTSKGNSVRISRSLANMSLASYSRIALTEQSLQSAHATGSMSWLRKASASSPTFTLKAVTAQRLCMSARHSLHG